MKERNDLRLAIFVVHIKHFFHMNATGFSRGSTITKATTELESACAFGGQGLVSADDLKMAEDIVKMASFLKAAVVTISRFANPRCEPDVMRAVAQAEVRELRQFGCLEKDLLLTVWTRSKHPLAKRKR